VPVGGAGVDGVPPVYTVATTIAAHEQKRGDTRLI